MGKYLKKFDTHTEYQTYITGQDAILPNVSYCEDNNDVHYNPVETYTIKLKYIVPDFDNFTEKHWDSGTMDWVIDQVYTEYDLPLCNENLAVTKINVDGVTISGDTYHVTEEDEGKELSVEIWLSDETTIPSGLFQGIYYLTEVDLGSTVLSIGDTTASFNDDYGYGGTFGGCEQLIRVNLNNCISIGSSAFALYSRQEDSKEILTDLNSGVGLIDINLSKVTHIGTSAFTGRYITTPTHFNELLPSIDIDNISGNGGLIFVNGVWLPNSYTTLNTNIWFCAVDENYENFIDYKSNIHLGNAIDTIVYANINKCVSPFEIPSTVTTMTAQGNGFGIFKSMGSYSSINPILIVHATTPPLANDRTFYNSYSSGYKAKWMAIYVPDSSVNAYKAATGWSSVASVIQPISQYSE